MSVFNVDRIKKKDRSFAGKREGLAVEKVAGTFSTASASQIRAWHESAAFPIRRERERKAQRPDGEAVPPR
jgi:hypothetical protein